MRIKKHIVRAVWTAGWTAGLCLAVGTLWPAPAGACSLIWVPPFQIDPNQRLIDNTPPTTFAGLNSETYSVVGTHCRGDRCTKSSCSGGAGIRISFTQPPSDDHNEYAQLGYRVEWVRGLAPASLQAALGKIEPLSPTGGINISLGDDIMELDGELRLIAVDRAGNESPASEPVHVEFSDCPRYFDDHTCVDSFADGCSAAPGRSSNATGWLGLSVFVLAVRALRRRRATKRV